jgi:Tfp pilus assembly protein PilF
MRTLNRPGRITVYLLLAVLAACQAPKPVSDNPYQRPSTAASDASNGTSASLRQLHNQALAAINEDQYDLATEYLQRAIKIEPRNGWSWYYLADIHWRQGQHDRCRAMLDRADAYGQDDAQLDDASRELRGRCH